MSRAGDSILRGAREALGYARGETDGFIAHVPEQVDVQAIRRKLGLSQASFASRFGFALDAVKNWEQERRQPDVAARAFLMVIENDPDAVLRALSAAPEESGDAKRAAREPRRSASGRS